MKKSSPLLRPFLIATLWVALEYFKFRGFLAFPWALLAHSVSNTPPAQLARFTGTWGISFIIAYANIIIVEAIQYISIHSISYRIRSITYYIGNINRMALQRHSCLFLILFLSTWVYGSYSISTSKHIQPDGYINTLLIQQNLDSWDNISSKDSLSHILDLNSRALRETSGAN